jgi:hypothetical protein
MGSAICSYKPEPSKENEFVNTDKNDSQPKKNPRKKNQLSFYY